MKRIFKQTVRCDDLWLVYAGGEEELKAEFGIESVYVCYVQVVKRRTLWPPKGKKTIVCHRSCGNTRACRRRESAPIPPNPVPTLPVHSSSSSLPIAYEGQSSTILSV